MIASQRAVIAARIAFYPENILEGEVIENFTANAWTQSERTPKED